MGKAVVAATVRLTHGMERRWRCSGPSSALVPGAKAGLSVRVGHTVSPRPQSCTVTIAR